VPVAASEDCRQENACQGVSRAKPLTLAQPPRRISTAGVDLEVVGIKTLAFRSARAAEHDARATREQAKAIALNVTSGVISTPFVARKRRRWEKYRDERGRVRRRRVVAVEHVPSSKAAETCSRWHSGRASGQRARMSTVGHCGDGQIAATCGCCGLVAEAPILCGVSRLCLRCSAKKATKSRKKFGVAYGLVQASARAAGLLNRYRRGGAYSERHIVLTAPHVVVDALGFVGTSSDVAGDADRQATAERRIAIMFKAWGYFSRAAQRYYRQCLHCGKQRDAAAHKVNCEAYDHEWEPLAPGAVTYRAFEWTPGSDGMGHPHFHLWNFGPYVPERDFHRLDSRRAKAIASNVYALDRRPAVDCSGVDCVFCGAGVKLHRGLRSWWSHALAKAGVNVAAEQVIVAVRRVWAKPIEFIREVRKPNGVVYRTKDSRIRLLAGGGEDLLGYLEGWCVATIDPETREQCGDDVIAGVYVALEAKRLTQATRGFLGAADEVMARACDCGTLAPKSIAATTWAMMSAAAVCPRGKPVPVDTGPPLPPLIMAPMREPGDDSAEIRREAIERFKERIASGAWADEYRPLRARSRHLLPNAPCYKAPPPMVEPEYERGDAAAPRHYRAKK
jgi:hypothetical protein